jgi:hypothetical protein
MPNHSGTSSHGGTSNHASPSNHESTQNHEGTPKHQSTQRLWEHSFNMWPMWALLTLWQCGSIAGSVGAGRPGNAGLPTGARPVPAQEPAAGPSVPAGSRDGEEVRDGR